MKVVEINNYPIDIHDGPIGIAASGGVDSSILLYILLTHAPGPIHVYTCANHQKKRINPVIALRVLGKLLDITKRSDVFHHTFFVETQTRISLGAPLDKFIIDHQLNLMYTAATALPPDEELRDKSKFTNDNGLYELRNQNIKRPLYTKPKYYSPWINHDKTFIKQIYDNLCMTDQLLPITRSCEDYHLIEGHCGRCWWCQERIWAFGKLE